MVVQHAKTVELDPGTLYRILQLRVDVFVVEQNCPYPELDGRDLEPEAVQLWVAREGLVIATLRLLLDDDGSARIGRVATRPDARGAGLAAELMDQALDLAGPRAVVLDAQSHLSGWYARYGFAVTGAEYLDDGIPHVPMRRDGRST